MQDLLRQGHQAGFCGEGNGARVGLVLGKGGLTQQATAVYCSEPSSAGGCWVSGRPAGCSGGWRSVSASGGKMLKG